MSLGPCKDGIEDSALPILYLVNLSGAIMMDRGHSMSNIWTKNKAIPIGLAFLLGVLPACGGASDNSGTAGGKTPENTQQPAAATNPIYDNKPASFCCC